MRGCAKWECTDPRAHATRSVCRPQMFMGVQARSGAARQAPPPLVPFGLDPEAHFQRALEAARRPLPNEDPPLADEDLRFAAFAMVP